MRKWCIWVFTFVACIQVFSINPWNGVDKQMVTPLNDVYTISNAAQLAWIADLSKMFDFQGKTIILDDDIDLGYIPPLTPNWPGIGSEEFPFQGVFNGQNHVVRNMGCTYMPHQEGLGLFNHVGSAGEVQNVAVISGSVFVEQKRGIGAIVGVNDGLLTHCFNMMTISAKNCSYVGGLVGRNGGIISYCYNVGIIDQLGSFVGGLAGENSGSIDHSYSAGYVTVGGALTGNNVGAIANTYYDRQICCQSAGQGVSGAESELTTMELQAIFASDNAWLCSQEGYPELSVFSASTSSLAANASHISTALASLYHQNSKFERANEITKNFVCHSKLNLVTWTSNHEEVVLFSDASATVFRPCDATPTILSATYNFDNEQVVKQIWVSPLAYSPFVPGMLNGGQASVCYGGDKKFKTISSVMAPTLGKDDDQTNFPYYYRLTWYELQDLDGDGRFTDTIWSPIAGQVELPQNEFNDWLVPTDVNGVFFFTLETRDSQCATTYKRSELGFTIVVFSEFDAGNIGNAADTVYVNLPGALVVPSLADAAGGDGNYHYQWTQQLTTIDFATGEPLVVGQPTRVLDGMDPLDAASALAPITQGGLYTFTRDARDASCNNQFTPSEGAVTIFAIPAINPGAIDATQTYYFCHPEQGNELIIHEIEAASGGCPNLVYRWFCNDVLLPNAVSPTLDLSAYPFLENETYVFRREVNDRLLLPDNWLPSRDTITIVILATFEVGEVSFDSIADCYDAVHPTTYPIQISELQPAAGGDFSYRWVLRYNQGEKVLDGENGVELQYVFDPSAYTLPNCFTFVRQVQNNECASEWATTNGRYVISLGRDEVDNQDVNVCDGDMPYQGIYVTSTGKTFPYQLSRDGEVVTLTDLTPTGCNLTVNLTCRVTVAPVAHFITQALFCPGDESAPLPIRIDQGMPDAYDITYNEAAHCAGLQDESGVIAPGDSMITFSTSPDLPAGNYMMYVTFRHGQCVGNTDSTSLSVSLPGYVQTRWDDVIFVDNSGTVDSLHLVFVDYQWFKNGEPLEGETRQYYQENPFLNGIYYCCMTDREGYQYYSCPIEAHPGMGWVTTTVERQPLCVPNPAAPGQVVRLSLSSIANIALYMSDGRLYSTSYHTDHLMAPQERGIYLVRCTTNNGAEFTTKLIVK